MTNTRSNSDYFPNGNILALIEGIRVHCRNAGTEEKFDAYMVALAEKAGLEPGAVEELLASDDLIVFYRP